MDQGEWRGEMTREGMLNRDLHVYMSERDHRAIREWAAAECRSVNGQVLHIIRQALAERPVGTRPACGSP
jgi:hypothetical protein